MTLCNIHCLIGEEAGIDMPQLLLLMEHQILVFWAIIRTLSYKIPLALLSLSMKIVLPLLLSYLCSKVAY